MEQDLVRRIVEAALLAAAQPLSLAQLASLFPDDDPAPAGSIERALEALREQSDERGIELVEVASGFRFQIRAEVQPWVARLWAERQTRYSRALLETLALIAYRQPITRGEIEQIRGVAVSSNIVRTLEEREWVRVVGHRDVPGKPALFGTTRTFLDYFGLKSLDQLPPLTELHDLPELEPQLALEPVAAAERGVAEPSVDAPPSEPIHAVSAGDGDEAAVDDEGAAADAVKPNAVIAARDPEPVEPRHAEYHDAVEPADAEPDMPLDPPSAADAPTDPERREPASPDAATTAADSGDGDELEDDAHPASSEQNP